jgi:hypothetical protein
MVIGVAPLYAVLVSESSVEVISVPGLVVSKPPHSSTGSTILLGFDVFDVGYLYPVAIAPGQLNIINVI